MKKSKELTNIFNECLERLMGKGETIDQCLQSYPEHADELKSLLQMAMVTRNAVEVQPNPEFKAKTRYQLLSAFQTLESKRRLPFTFRLSRGWAIALTTALVVLLVGGSSVAAAVNSMPGSPLYPVKLATEKVQMAFTFSEIGKAELHAKLADRRVSEITYVADKGTLQQVEQTVKRFKTHVNMLVSLTSAQLKTTEEATSDVAMAPTFEEAPFLRGESNDVMEPTYIEDNHKAKLRTLLGQYAADHPAQLRATLQTASPSFTPLLIEAIVISETGYEQALESLN